MKPKKRYQDMNTAELAEATKEFDEEFVLDRARPMNAAERAIDRKLRHPGGRPRIGGGAAKINITIERGLLAQADAMARKKKIGRSELIAQGLQLLMRRKAS